MKPLRIGTFEITNIDQTENTFSLTNHRNSVINGRFDPNQDILQQIKETYYNVEERELPPEKRSQIMIGNNIITAIPYRNNNFSISTPSTTITHYNHNPYLHRNVVHNIESMYNNIQINIKPTTIQSNNIAQIGSFKIDEVNFGNTSFTLKNPNMEIQGKFDPTILSQKDITKQILESHNKTAESIVDTNSQQKTLLSFLSRFFSMQPNSQNKPQQQLSYQQLTNNRLPNNFQSIDNLKIGNYDVTDINPNTNTFTLNDGKGHTLRSNFNPQKDIANQIITAYHTLEPEDFANNLLTINQLRINSINVSNDFDFKTYQNSNIIKIGIDNAQITINNRDNTNDNIVEQINNAFNLKDYDMCNIDDKAQTMLLSTPNQNVQYQFFPETPDISVTSLFNETLAKKNNQYIPVQTQTSMPIDTNVPEVPKAIEPTGQTPAILNEISGATPNAITDYINQISQTNAEQPKINENEIE